MAGRNIPRYEPAPRYYQVSQTVGSKVLVHGGWAKDISDKSKQHVASLVEVFDPYSEFWEQKQIGGEAPSAGTYAAASASIGDDLFSFGGLDSDNKELNTLHKLDTSASRWRWCQLSSPSAKGSPMRKYGCGMAAFGDKLGVFGGYGVPSLFATTGSSFMKDEASADGRVWTNEFHVFHLKEGVWSCPATTGEKPPPCAGFTFTAIDDRRAVLFGGVNGEHGKMKDVYIIDLQLMHWTKLPRSGERGPEERSRHAACCLNYGRQHPQLLVSGGENSERKALADIWILDVDTGTWREESATLKPRYAHCTTAFSLCPGLTEVTMFGGKESGCLLGNTVLLEFRLQKGAWNLETIVTHDQLGAKADRLAEKVQTLTISSVPTPDPETPPLPLAEQTQGQNSDRLKEEEKKTTLHDLTIDHEIQLTDLKFGDILGRGGFGTVFRGKWVSKGLDVALKKVGVPPEACDAKVMAELGKHPNIIGFFGYARNYPDTVIVTALASNGSLYDYLHVKKQIATQEQSLIWAKQVAYAMAYMHKLGLVHRDLKSSNILFADDMTAQVCDFGTARTLDGTTFASKVSGTLRWMAPEVAEDDAINKKCDVFSFSLVIWELMEHKIPFHDARNELMASMAIMGGKRPPISSAWPDYLSALTKQSWSQNPQVRPSFDDIVTSLDNKMYFKR